MGENSATVRRIRPTTLDSMRDYRERLHVPLVWWLLALPSALIIAVTVYAGLQGPWPGIIVGGLLAGCAAILVSLGLGTVEVGAGAPVGTA